jgi:tRNA dimethylallyltransferase
VIVGVAGPTAAGKTDLAVRLALAWDAEIVSADALMVYRGMDIGTAKPTPAERRGVAHHAIDVVDPDQPFDAAAFVALADEVIRSRPRVIAVGGTHLYLRSLARGLVDAAPVDYALRAALEAAPDLWDRLAAVDPVLAARLHPRDRVRLVRGLEAHAATGRPLSDLHAAHAAAPDRHEVAGIWVDRPDLDERIDARVAGMVALGYRDEVAGLLARGYGGCKPMLGLGYRHFAAHVRGLLDLDEAVRLTRRDTRRFARKQRNWRRALGWEAAPADPWDAANRAAERAWARAPRSG